MQAAARVEVSPEDHTNDDEQTPRRRDAQAEDVGIGRPSDEIPVVAHQRHGGQRDDANSQEGEESAITRSASR